MVFAAFFLTSNFTNKRFVSIPSRGLWFLRLIYVIVFKIVVSKFQSLVGVYGFCGCWVLRNPSITRVSIPSRGLWFLRRLLAFADKTIVGFNP